MKISIVKDPSKKDYRLILVDGVNWGAVRATSHGPRGASYYFLDSERSNVSGPGGGTITVHSNSFEQDRRRYEKSSEPPVPLEQRLVAAVEKAIRTKSFRSPDALAEAKRRRREKYLSDQRVAAEKEDASFRTKARKAIGTRVTTLLNDPMWLGDGEHKGKAVKSLEDRIIEAMKWAQTR